MAKKAQTVSWRTLMRRADKSRSPRKATALRKQAYELRTAERATKLVKAAPTARRNIAGAKRAAKGWATRRANLGSNQTGGIPGHGEIVGGQLAQLAERLAHLARTKGGKDAIQGELMALEMRSKHMGCVETDRNATKRLVEVQQTTADRVVCAFSSPRWTVRSSCIAACRRK